MKTLFRSLLVIILVIVCSAKTYATIYDWTGALSTDWSTAGNWTSTKSGVTTSPAATYPGPTDTARIGVVAFTNAANYPVISAGGATSVGNIVWGTEIYLTVNLTVNTAFTVNGNVEDSSSAPGNGQVSQYTFNLSGTGSFTVTGSLLIGYSDIMIIVAPGNNNNFTFNSSITQATIDGSVYMNAYQGDTNHRGFLPALYVTGGTFTTTTIQTFLANSTIPNKLITSNIVVGNSSGTPTATLQLTGANALPNFTPNITNYLTFNNPGATIDYSGASQTVYTDAAIANLSSTVNYYSIKFSGTGVKTASGGNINVAGDFTNALANDASDYLNLSALAQPSTNTVNFNGTTQNLQGGGGFGTTFYNVKFTNSGTKSMTSGTFYLADIGVLTMAGSNPTQLAAGNQIFTLISDATSTATIAAIPLGNSITGTVNSQRYVHGSPTSLAMRGYRLMSSNVYQGTVGGYNVCDLTWWLSGTIITGIPGNGFDPSPLNNPSTYIFREDSQFSNVNFPTGDFKGINKINNSPTYLIGTQKLLTISQVADTTVTIPVGNGMLLFFRGNRTSPNGTTSGTKTSNPFNYPENVTFTNTGTLNTGTINVKLWYRQDNYLGYTNVANSASKGYNLLGNPYASTINWEKFNRNSSVTKSSLYGAGFTVPATIWMYNPTNKQYEAYIQKSGSVSTADTTTNLDPGTAVGCATNMIASGQGFFVRATATNQTFSFRETAKTNTQPSTTKLATFMGMPVNAGVAGDPVMRLDLAKDGNNTDEIVIRLNDTSSAAFSPLDDAEDLGGSSDVQVSLSSISSDNIRLAIDSRPLPQNAPQVIPLFVDAASSGTYTLTLKQMGNLPQVYQVVLRDTYMQDSVIMQKGTTYSFSIDKTNAATFGENRFQLVISQNAQNALKLLSFNASKAQNGSSLINWTVTNEFNTTTFYVERSTDKGLTFLPVGSLQANNAGSYNLSDKNPVVGENDYRLKMIDYNNNITYSNVVALVYTSVSGNSANISIYPNPTSSSITLSLAQNSKLGNFKTDPYDIQIVSSSGMVVKQASSQDTSWQSNISDLQPGTYMVQVTNHNNKNLIGTASFVKD